MQTVSIKARRGFSTRLPWASTDFSWGIVLMTIPTMDTATNDIEITDTTCKVKMKIGEEKKHTDIKPELLYWFQTSPWGPRSFSGTLQTSHPQSHLPPPSSPSWSCPPSARSPAPSSRWTCHSSTRPGNPRSAPNSGGPPRRQGHTSRQQGAAFQFCKSWGLCWRIWDVGRRRTRSLRWSSRCRSRWSPGVFGPWRAGPGGRGGQEREVATTPG